MPPGTALCGGQVGNLMWRSPEAHAGGPIKKPSDMFSFGIVVSVSANTAQGIPLTQTKCTYAMLKAVVLGWDNGELTEDIEPLSIVLEKQMSYSAEDDEILEFLCYLGLDHPWHEIFIAVWNTFGEDHPRKPFELWYGPVTADKDFTSLVRGLTYFNPDKRLTATQALAHKWFADV